MAERLLQPSTKTYEVIVGEDCSRLRYRERDGVFTYQAIIGSGSADEMRAMAHKRLNGGKSVAYGEVNTAKINELVRAIQKRKAQE